MSSGCATFAHIPSSDSAEHWIHMNYRRLRNLVDDAACAEKRAFRRKNMLVFVTI